MTKPRIPNFVCAPESRVECDLCGPTNPGRTRHARMKGKLGMAYALRLKRFLVRRSITQPALSCFTDRVPPLHFQQLLRLPRLLAIGSIVFERGRELLRKRAALRKTEQLLTAKCTNRSI
eukprot:2792241-Pleurochrysis_carterae.AAC.2